MSVYTHGHVNAHNHLKGPQVLRKRGCDGFGLNEANTLAVTVAKWDRYRETYNHNARDQRRGSKANLLMVRNKYESYGQITLQISESVDPTRFAPDRWLSAEIIKVPNVGLIAPITVHLNAVVKGKEAHVPHVREYVQSVNSLDRMIGLLMAEGAMPIVSGDMNISKHDAGEQKFRTPYDVFRKYGMGVESMRIDAIAYDPRLRPTRQLVVIPKSTVNSDHPGLILPLERRRARHGGIQGG